MSRAEDHVWRRYRKEKDDVEMNFVTIRNIAPAMRGLRTPVSRKGERVAGNRSTEAKCMSILMTSLSSPSICRALETTSTTRPSFASVVQMHTTQEKAFSLSRIASRIRKWYHATR